MRIRRALSIPEVLAAAAVVGLLIAFVSQMLISAATQQQAADRRALAAIELSNVVERVAMLNYEETTLERLSAIELSPAVAEVLPEAALKFDLDVQIVDDLPTKIVTIDFVWTNRNNVPARPLQLAVWKHQPAEASP